MDNYFLVSISLFIAPILLLGIIARLGRKSYPPGPMGLPVIGNMMMMDQLTHRGLAKLAQRYGGLFHLKMGFVHMMVVSSPEEARQVLQVHDTIFSNRPATIAISYLTYDRADMAFAHYGPFWRQMRKLCVMRLFSRKRAESWQSVRDEVDYIVQALTDRAGCTVNVGEHVFNLTKNIIYRAAFGSSSSEGQDEFISILQEFSKLFGAFNIADFIPFFSWVDPNGLNDRLVNARSALDGFIDRIIDDHINQKKAISGQHVIKEEDMVDDLLNFYSEEAKVNESEDLQNAIKLTKDNIKAIIMDVMFGGTETGYAIVEPDQVGLAALAGVDRVARDADLMSIIWSKMDKPTRVNLVLACKKWAMELIKEYYRPGFDWKFSERVRMVNFTYHEMKEYTETNGTYTRIKYKCVCDLFAELHKAFHPRQEREALLNAPSDIDFNNFDATTNNQNYSWRIQCGGM
ncbi:hypothetical protein SOVF_123620 [Spinacia oleracea]|nr:hypothetical protein SOVF_123620 [Spinacia oleracea]